MPSPLTRDAVRSYRTISPLPPAALANDEGRYLSVALSVASPRLDVIQPAARWSSDFPPRLSTRRSSDPLYASGVTAARARIIPRLRASA